VYAGIGSISLGNEKIWFEFCNGYNKLLERVWSEELLREIPCSLDLSVIESRERRTQFCYRRLCFVWGARGWQRIGLALICAHRIKLFS